MTAFGLSTEFGHLERHAAAEWQTRSAHRFNDVFEGLENPVERWYERLGFEVIEQKGPSLTMKTFAAGKMAENSDAT